MRALYDYTAQDMDEISLIEGEVLELVKEGEKEWHPRKRAGNDIFFLFSDDSGWWSGKTTGGLEGFFPGSYVEKC